VTHAQRSWITKRLLALATCVVSSVAVAVLAVLGPGLRGLLSALEQMHVPVPFFGSPTFWGGLFRFFVGAAVLVGHDCFLYWFGVHPRVRRRIPILPGAVVAAGLQLVFGAGYRMYLSRIGDGSAYSAGLAVIGVSLTALYLWAIALLVGAVVNVRVGEAAAMPGGVAAAAGRTWLVRRLHRLLRASAKTEAEPWIRSIFSKIGWSRDRTSETSSSAPSRTRGICCGRRFR
jgi:membrane protein